MSGSGLWHLHNKSKENMPNTTNTYPVLFKKSFMIFFHNHIDTYSKLNLYAILIMYSRFCKEKISRKRYV